MATRTYSILRIQATTNEFVAPPRHARSILMLNKESGKGKPMREARRWVTNEDTYKAQLTPIPVCCPMCGEDAGLWWLMGYHYSERFVVCDCECNQAIQL